MKKIEMNQNYPKNKHSSNFPAIFEVSILVETLVMKGWGVLMVQQLTTVQIQLKKREGYLRGGRTAYRDIGDNYLGKDVRLGQNFAC